MKVSETYTFIVSRVYGPPVSVSLSAWRVYLGLGTAAVLLCAMLVMSLLFIATFPRMHHIERERDELRKQRDALQEQILSSNQEAFETREDLFVQAAYKATQGTQQESLATERDTEDVYQPPVRITQVTTKVDRRRVEVVFRISEVSQSQDNRGGFLFAVFENHDKNPIEYAASPTVGVNQEGFPQTYKAGVRFPRVRRSVTYRRRVKLENPNDYFTHITLYLFSLRGGLLVKDRFALDPDLFDGEGKGSRIQKLLSS